MWRVCVCAALAAARPCNKPTAERPAYCAAREQHDAAIGESAAAAPPAPAARAAPQTAPRPDWRAMKWPNELGDAPPNILLVNLDDAGYGDLAANEGSRLGNNTPHFDALARESLRLTDFHSAAAVCSASRGALLTGRRGGRADLRRDGSGFSLLDGKKTNPGSQARSAIRHSRRDPPRLQAGAAAAFGGHDAADSEDRGLRHGNGGEMALRPRRHPPPVDARF